MLDALKILVIMSILGGISSGFGGLLGGIVKIKSHNTLAMLFEITAGMMTGIVCFDMLPEAFEISNILYSIVGLVIGVALVYILDIVVQRANRSKNKYGIMSLVIMLSMALHNAIEGLAIGSGMIYSLSLGTSILIAIFLHDIPEGMVVGIANKTNNKKLGKIVLNSAFVGMFVGIGAFVGELVGGIKDSYVSLSLSLAAGAMLYIVACDLIPSSKELSKKKYVSIIYILGIIIGALITKI